MNRRIAALVSNCVLALTISFIGLWIWLEVAFPGIPRHPDHPGSAAGAVGLGLAALFGGAGALIVRRQPRNSVGWIFLALALLYSSGLSLESYAWASFSQDEWWPLTKTAAYLVDVTFQNPASFGLFVFFFLLFPDGSVPSPRWRWLAYLAGASMTGLFFNGALRPADVLNTIPIPNPLGVEALEPVREVLDTASFGGLVVALFGSVASLAVRLRRARGEERQQIKWFLTAAAVLASVIAIAPFTFFRPDFPKWVWPFVLLTSLSLIPIAAAVAILKYRLYDIDVIINRTLVYAALTVILAATYLAIVVLLQLVLQPVTAESDVAVAASTLGVAALFRPLRTRVQGFIDRRFYRRKYDAVQTLDRFSARLREEVDLDALSGELVGVVQATMQPAHASLWLRNTEVRG